MPLVARTGPADYRAHELWLQTLVDGCAPDRLRLLRRRAVTALLERGLLSRAGEVATAGAEWALLSVVAERLVGDTLMAYPYDAGRRLLAAVPTEELWRPGLLLLAAADRWQRDYRDAGFDRLLDAAEQTGSAAPPTENGRAAAPLTEHGRAAAPLTEHGRAAARALGVAAATARHDLDRLSVLARTRAEDPAAVTGVAVCAEAVRFELGGRPDEALQRLADIDTGAAPLLSRLASRIRLRCLLLAGRPAEAGTVGRTGLAQLPDEHLRHVPSFCAWLAGSVDAFADVRDVEEYALLAADGSARDRVLGAFIHASVAASWGLTSELARTVLADLDLVGDAPRDDAFLTNARATIAVLDHDEVAAAATFEAYLRRYQPVPGPPEGHLRRMLPLGYLLAPQLRDLWDSADLSDHQQRLQHLARLLHRARSGEVDRSAELRVELAFTALPLPWSVELACRLHQGGHRGGHALATLLADRAGSAARAELRRLARIGATAAGAKALLAEVGLPPTQPVHVSVLGPVSVRHGEPASAAPSTVDTHPHLRRRRVRELLAVLVVERRIARDRAAALLWPDLDPDAAHQNLRVTLTHLRRLLEPERAAHEAGWVLRSTPEDIWLHGGDELVVDLWRCEQLLGSARRARQSGDLRACARDLTAALTSWRGRPLADLDRVADLASRVAALGDRLVRAAVELGELLVRTGRPADAAPLAARALDAAPYDEPAHRLAMAAALASRHPAAAALAARNAEAACRDLGTVPEESTRILVARCGAERPESVVPETRPPLRVLDRTPAA